MAEPEQNWRSKWDEECPLTIGVALQNWEQWSDAALRDELKRIRDTGFQTVRVTFNRDTDIEKSLGMMNWRNPDRFFDAAEQAGLKLWCEPGNEPHHSLRTDDDSGSWNVGAFADVTKWVQRFVRQYREHPALLAWIMEIRGFLWDPDKTDFQTEASFRKSQEEAAGLLRACYDADPNHPILTKNHYCHTPISHLKAYGLDSVHTLFGAPGNLVIIATEGSRELGSSLLRNGKTGR